MSKPHNNYALDSQPLGIGGQAEVFRARDKRTNSYVALKRLLPDLRRDEDSLARMRREIDVQTGLSHVNIMPVLDYSEQYYWYTMPIATGFLKMLPSPIDPRTIINIVEQAAQGLFFAHANGNIHRDITPNNILELQLDNGNQAWVVSDWGLVRRRGFTTVVRTAPGFQFGTAGFAAPETWQDAHAADERADVYSLGRVVAWCVTRTWPIPNVSLIPDGLFNEFVQRTTRLDPSERLTNMHEVLRELATLKELIKSI